jgi:TPR repeat protein
MIRFVLTIAIATLFRSVDQDPLPAFQGFLIRAGEIESKKIEALQGSGLAALQLCNYYDVVLLDRKESLYWATISAENDYPSGMYELGFRLAEAHDARSKTRARYWLEKADRNGQPLARDLLNRLRDAKPD